MGSAANTRQWLFLRTSSIDGERSAECLQHSVPAGPNPKGFPFHSSIHHVVLTKVRCIRIFCGTILGGSVGERGAREGYG